MYCETLNRPEWGELGRLAVTSGAPCLDPIGSGPVARLAMAWAGAG